MKKLLLIILINSCQCAFAQSVETSKHPIDKEFMKCVGGSLSPRGVVGVCAGDAIEKWESQINKYYDLLMKKIKRPQHKKELKEAQDAWTAYKEKEFKNITNMVYGDGKSGSMYGAITAMTMMDFIKSRALDLERYYEQYEIEE